MYGLRFFLVGALFTLPSFVFAQTTQNEAIQGSINSFIESQQQSILQQAEIQKLSIGDNLDVKTNPQNPAPGANVTISIESYLTDLYKANIIWTLNGKVSLRGFGKTSFTFKNGSAGKTTTVGITLTTNTGDTITKDFYFTPVGVTVLWEADTYTPPFYKGKALMVPQANIKIVALSDSENTGGSTNASKLVYTWKKDDLVDTRASGYGKNFYSFVGPKPLTNTKVSLRVSSFDDKMQSETNVYLPQVRPFVLFYEKDPLLGILYQKTLADKYSLNKKEFSVTAEPFFFSNERGEEQSILYKWSSNGKSVQNYTKNITLRNNTGGEGSSILSLSVKSVPQSFQSSSKDLRIDFTEITPEGRPLF